MKSSTKNVITAAGKKVMKPLAVPGNGIYITPERLDIKKTYKIYIGGKFPRSESGRYLQLKDATGKIISNYCRCSKKDFRDSIVSNLKAQKEWSARSAYNKGQILYRIAETLEGRKSQFIQTLICQGTSAANARNEADAAVDLLVYYSGWTDKYIQIFSSINPVESSHFNFSYPEPCGIVAGIAPVENGLLGLCAMMAPIIAGGNSCTLIASDSFPLTAIEFAEVLHASDVPGGVVNILTGQQKELTEPAASHMEVNAVASDNLSQDLQKTIELNAALNVKRVIRFEEEDILSPYRIMSCQEIKTTWHPVGQ